MVKRFNRDMTPERRSRRLLLLKEILAESQMTLQRVNSVMSNEDKTSKVNIMEQNNNKIVHSTPLKQVTDLDESGSGDSAGGDAKQNETAVFVGEGTPPSGTQQETAQVDDEAFGTSLSCGNLLEEIQAALSPSASLSLTLEHSLHTVASYRTARRLARMSLCLDPPDTPPPAAPTHSSLQKHITSLRMEADIQRMLQTQASKAVTVSEKQTDNTSELSTETVESCKALLLAGLREEAALREIERLNGLKGLRGPAPAQHQLEGVGQVTLSEIAVGLEPTTRRNNADSSGVLMCVFLERSKVVCTKPVSLNVAESTTAERVTWSEALRLHELSEDCCVNVRVYKLDRAEKQVPRLKCLKKLALKQLWRSTRQLHTSSSWNLSIESGDPPGSPAPPGRALHVTPGFQCVGEAVLRLSRLTGDGGRTQLRLHQSLSPVSGQSLSLRLETGVSCVTRCSALAHVFHSSWNTWRHVLLVAHTCSLALHLSPQHQQKGEPPLATFFTDATTELEPTSQHCARPHSMTIPLINHETLTVSLESHSQLLQWRGVLQDMRTAARWIRH